MDEPQRPAELSEDAWQATPPEVRQFIALLVTKLAALEARLNQNSQNSSKPPSSDPPSAPPRPAKTPRGKPKTKGAQPGHPDQQRMGGIGAVAEADRTVATRARLMLSMVGRWL
jgi:transposase